MILGRRLVNKSANPIRNQPLTSTASAWVRKKNGPLDIPKRPLIKSVLFELSRTLSINERPDVLDRLLT